MLLNIKGLSEAKIMKMVDACKQMTPSSTWRCATEVAEEVSYHKEMLHFEAAQLWLQHFNSQKVGVRC